MIEGAVNENYESPDHREIRRMLHGEDKLVV